MNLLDRIDHIIIVAPDLEQGMDHAEAALGVRPVPAGQHPAYGTCNALLSLGPETYFEVIAPDPALKPPTGGVLWGMAELTEPRLATWVMRAEDLDDVLERAGHIGLGNKETGHRMNPDGSRVEWVVTSPFAFPLQGAVPFLIQWGNTPHPSTVLPPGGELVDLRLEHPDAAAVRAAYAALGIDMVVQEASSPGFIATINTVNGPVSLR